MTGFGDSAAQPEAKPSDKAERFLEFLSQPAEDDDADEVSAWMEFAVCPNCSAGYPTFYSPTGSLGTFCDGCGWSSDEADSES